MSSIVETSLTVSRKNDERFLDSARNDKWESAAAITKPLVGVILNFKRPKLEWERIVL
jgi:hypothetical protein